MNEFEKQVSNSLSEEEQEKIAGGKTISPTLTLNEFRKYKKKYEEELKKREEELKYQEYLRYREYLENEKKQNTAETTPTTEPNTTNL